MSDDKKEQEKKAQIIHVMEDDIGVTRFSLNPSMGEKIVIVLDESSSDISD